MAGRAYRQRKLVPLSSIATPTRAVEDSAGPPSPYSAPVTLIPAPPSYPPPEIPSITYEPASSSSTVNTYDSTFSKTDDSVSSAWPPLADDSLADSDEEGSHGQHLYHHYLNAAAASSKGRNKSVSSNKKNKNNLSINIPSPNSSRRPSLSPSDDAIPSMLPPYRAAPTALPIKASDPKIFGNLFPSMDRLSVRHDDRSSDGNLSLRVDAVVAGSVNGFGHGSRKRYSAVQLFHFRMHDLARREFSLRRYGRDSGREVCTSKRAYAEPSAVSTAIRTVKAPFRHSATNQAGTHCSGPGSRKRSSAGDASTSAVPPPVAIFDGPPAALHPLSASTPAVQSQVPVVQQQSNCPIQALFRPVVPTDTIKLEFSNYARVDVRRHHNKRYEFEWWGHTYAWKRVVDKTLGGVSFHLIRDGHGAPVAHVVPEMRSPNQVQADEEAGGWIPPCYMWISDKSIIEAVTDVADIVIATGLIALVDDSIKERWQAKKPTHKGSRRSSLPNDATTPRASFMQGLLRRSNYDTSKQPQEQLQVQPTTPTRPVFKAPVW